MNKARVFVSVARNVVKGEEVLDRGVWQTVARVTPEIDRMGMPVTWLLFEGATSAFLFDANELLTVRRTG